MGNKRDLLCLIDGNVKNTMQEDCEEVSLAANDEWLPDLVHQPSLLEKTLNRRDFSLLKGYSG